MNLLQHAANPSTQSHQLCFRELSSSEDLYQLFRLRHLVYSNQGYWDAQSRHLDIDSYDRHSRFVGAFYRSGDRAEELIGGSRLILAEGEPNGQALDRLLQESGAKAPPERRCAFTAQELMGFEQIVAFAQRAKRKLVEFGRTVIHPEWQNGKLGVRLVYAIYGLSLRYGIDLGLALVPPRLVGFYSRCGCHLLDGKGSTHYTHTELAPVVVDLHALVGEQREALIAHHYLQQDGAWIVPLYDQSNRLEPLPIQDHPLLPLLRHSPDLEDATLSEIDRSADLWSPGLAGQLSYLECLQDIGVSSLTVEPFGLHQESMERLTEGASRLGLSLSCRVSPDQPGLDSLAQLAQRFGARSRLLVQADALAAPAETVSHCLEEARRLGLAATLWMNRASQAGPEILEPILAQALESQIECLCLSDSQGIIDPGGVAQLIAHVRHYFLSRSWPIRIEWHGSNQGGQALANALAAVEAGADKIHSSLSDCRSVPMQHLLLHLHQMAGRTLTLPGFKSYLAWARQNLGWVDSEGLESRIPETIVQTTKVGS